uniref:Uncharacterized protein n=1 Tax=Anopheles merus TaxID=30066 RepID=A0A182VHR0_ANOME
MDGRWDGKLPEGNSAAAAELIAASRWMGWTGWMGDVIDEGTAAMRSTDSLTGDGLGQGYTERCCAGRFRRTHPINGRWLPSAHPCWSGCSAEPNAEIRSGAFCFDWLMCWERPVLACTVSVQFYESRHHTDRPLCISPEQGDRTEVGPIDQMAQLHTVLRVDGGRTHRQKEHRISRTARRQYRIILQVQLKPQLIGNVLQHVRRQIVEHVRPQGIDLVQYLVVLGFACVRRDDGADQEQQDVGGPDPATEQEQRLGPLVQEVPGDGQGVSTLHTDLERDHQRTQIAIGDGHVVLHIVQQCRHELGTDGHLRQVLLEVCSRVAERWQPVSVRDRVVVGIALLIVTPQHIDQEVGLEPIIPQQGQGQQWHNVQQTGGPVQHVQRVHDGLQQPDLLFRKPKQAACDDCKVPVDRPEAPNAQQVQVDHQAKYVRYEQQHPVDHVPPAHSIAYDSGRFQHHLTLANVSGDQLQGKLHPQHRTQHAVKELNSAEDAVGKVRRERKRKGKCDEMQRQYEVHDHLPALAEAAERVHNEGRQFAHESLIFGRNFRPAAIVDARFGMIRRDEQQGAQVAK